jgi:hypothetical protein
LHPFYCKHQANATAKKMPDVFAPSEEICESQRQAMRSVLPGLLQRALVIFKPPSGIKPSAELVAFVESFRIIKRALHHRAHQICAALK